MDLGSNKGKDMPKLDPCVADQDMLRAFESTLAALASERYPGSGLGKATRYALLGSGKRVRPRLTLLSALACGGDWRMAMRAAIAVEMVHTYSLVHDDLPCMDDDDWRRGRPTVHKVHGEAMALLTGDALLTDAFMVLSSQVVDVSSEGWESAAPLPAAPLVVQQVRELAHAAGGTGMVEGQALDLLHTGGLAAGKSVDTLDRIHQLKTGRLLAAACAMGAWAANARADQVSRLREFGLSLGLAFQILDDILDEAEGTGKSRGKDVATGKLTYVSLLGPEAAQQAAEAKTAQAMALLGDFGPAAGALREFSVQLLHRRS